jgi:hypothetical protein
MKTVGIICDLRSFLEEKIGPRPLPMPPAPLEASYAELAEYYKKEEEWKKRSGKEQKKQKKLLMIYFSVQKQLSGV